MWCWRLQLYKPSIDRSKKIKMLHELMETDIPNLITQLHTVQKRQEKRNEERAKFMPLRISRPPPLPSGTLLAVTPGAADSPTGSAPLGAANDWMEQKAALAAATSQLRSAVSGMPTGIASGLPRRPAPVNPSCTANRDMGGAMGPGELELRTTSTGTLSNLPMALGSDTIGPETEVQQSWPPEQ